MISPIIISHQKKSMENGAVLPLSQAVIWPQLGRTKPTSARHGGVNMHRPFATDRVGILTPPEELGLETEPLSTGDNLGRGRHRGFSSITITARRVGPPANSLVWDTVRDSLCPNCRAKNALLQGPPALARETHLCQHNESFTCTEFPSNGSIEGLKVPRAHTRLCTRQEYWITHMDDKEDSFSSDNSPSGKVPLVFSSCVHLQVSQQCPKTIYYLDKSLSVPLEQPQIASPKMHRSVLSLSLRCSSHRLTADGVDSTANDEPISRALPQELLEGKQDLLNPQWGQAQEGHWKESPALVPIHMGSGKALAGSPPLENVKCADVGRNQVPVRKEKEDCATCPTSSHADQLSIHIPGWSYRAALEVRRPQFISRSQERLKKLKHMVQQRKAQQKENLGQKQSLLPVRAHKKQFTVPHPLSGKLQMAQKAWIEIYNNLPEVKKKKEEQKKRVILQSNRLRAEVFKKQLLDQLLQRNAV
ncbi:D7Ertd443e [Phodopus roborovskii]|uniref:D7Ertd443e protein n=1 Tax=Phodopus roborovskii TaxID=109678 RepID=A0AAU9YQD7_PHORO|nr:D7Ertd443e [Phodopus roborovskii]